MEILKKNNAWQDVKMVEMKRKQTIFLVMKLVCREVAEKPAKFKFNKNTKTSAKELRMKILMNYSKRKSKNNI